MLELGPVPRGRVRLAHAGFFVLRTPALPTERLATLGRLGAGWDDAGDADAATALATALRDGRQALTEILRDPLVRDALYVASPSLYRVVNTYDEASETLTTREPEPRGKREERATLSLVRYVQRMCTRPTPFGLFSGVGLGRVEGSAVALTAPARDGYIRRVRIDRVWLRALIKQLSTDPAVRAHLRYVVNPTAYPLGQVLRFTQAVAGARGTPIYVLAESRLTAGIRLLLHIAREPTVPAALVTAVVEDGVSTTHATAFVEAAINLQLLVPHGIAALTGDEALDALLTQMPGPEELPEGNARNALVTLLELRERTHKLNGVHSRSCAPAYAGVASLLRGTGEPGDAERALQVDFAKRGPAGTIPPFVVEEVVAGVQALHRIVARPEPIALTAFKDAFEERYGEAQVPLLQALDEDFGLMLPVAQFETDEPEVRETIGGTPRDADAMSIGHPDQDARTGEPTHPHLLRRFCEALRAGDDNLLLSDDDVEALAHPNAAPLPISLCAFGTLVPPDVLPHESRRWCILLQGAHGPSTANTLGRFAGMLPGLTDTLRAYTAEEARRYPHRILAEIVYEPNGRAANITTRPLIRDYEIPYLGESGAPPHLQLAPEDLFLFVHNSRLVLWSRRLGVEVLPRLGNAYYAPPDRSPPVYRLLQALELQGVCGNVRWSWGDLERAPFLPRVSYRNVIFALARWNLDRRTLAPFRESDSLARIRGARRLGAALGMPRQVLVVQSDNVLLLDFDCPLSIEAAAALLRTARQAVLQECIPPLAAGGVHGDDGTYRHEFALPLLTNDSVPASRHGEPRPVYQQRTVHPPGSEWLYIKVYASVPVAQHLLLDVLTPLLEHARAASTITGWFFVRYHDRGPHLRLRMQALPGRQHVMLAQLAPAIGKALEPALAAGACDQWTVETYEPEVARYGGNKLLPESEALFCHDSRAVVRILAATRAGEVDHPERADAPDTWIGEVVNGDMLWDAAVLSVGTMLRDWGLTRDEVVVFCRSCATRTAALLGTRARQLEATASRTFRGARQRLVPLAVGDLHAARVLPHVISDALASRSRDSTPIITRLRTVAGTEWPETRAFLLTSHVHMHVNRLFTRDHRGLEYLVYSCLARAHAAALALTRGESVSTLIN